MLYLSWGVSARLISCDPKRRAELRALDSRRTPALSGDPPNSEDLLGPHSGVFYQSHRTTGTSGCEVSPVRFRCLGLDSRRRVDLASAHLRSRRSGDDPPSG